MPDCSLKDAEGPQTLTLQTLDSTDAVTKSCRTFTLIWVLTAASEPLTASQLSEDNCYALVTVVGGRTGVVDDALRVLGHKRRITLWLPYFMTAAGLVANSDLILTLPRRAAHAAAGSLGLTPFKPPVALETFGYRMVWHERTHNDAACARLRKLIVESKTPRAEHS